MKESKNKTAHPSMRGGPSSGGTQPNALVVEFLTALGHALAAMSLYGAAHPSRTVRRTSAHERLAALLAVVHPLRLTFLDGNVIVGLQALREWRTGGLAQRLGAAGVQRLEFEGTVPTDDVMTALLEILYAAVGPNGTPVTHLVSLPGIRLGPVALVGDGAAGDEATGGEATGEEATGEEATGDEATGDEATGDLNAGRAETGQPDSAPSPYVDAFVAGGLEEELEAMQWITASTASKGQVPMAEVEAVVRSLSLAMQAEHDTLIPLMSLKSIDEYTTVHACNVSMLSMGLAESLGFASRDVRAVGTAALLRDIGKVKVPESLFRKAAALTDAERDLMRTHPAEGAKLLGKQGEGHALSAIVAYEHHIWSNGAGGYPAFEFPRRTHYVSRLVQVCDVYDALCSERPYRAAWPRARVLHHMRLQAGRELDYDLLLAFFDLIDRAERRQPATG